MPRSRSSLNLLRFLYRLDVMTTPDKVSAALRRIAARIESSDKPSLTQVNRDLKRVLAMVIAPVREERVRRIAMEIVRLAADDVEVSLWDTEEGENVEEAYDTAHKQSDNLLPNALKSLKHDIDLFIEEIRRDPSKPKKSGEDDDDGVVTSAPKTSDIKEKGKSGQPKPPSQK